MLVLAGNQTTPIGDTNPFAGQPQANLWLGKTDELWNFGKPAGWGVCFETKIKKNQPSQPFLLTGFKSGCLHIWHDSHSSACFSIEVYFHGTGKWCRFADIKSKNGYAFYNFPDGFSGHWIRLIPNISGIATAQFFYV